jgi:arsenite oxidase small subunit
MKKTDREEGQRMAEEAEGKVRNASSASSAPSAPLPEVDERRRKLITWLWRLPVLAVIGSAGYAGYEAYFHFNRLTPSATPTFKDGEAQKIADVAELAEVWDSVEFTYETPSILVRLPTSISGGVSVDDKHFAAFTRICTHQGCPVTLNKNLEAVAVAFNYRSDVPVLSCQCHFSVFDMGLAGKAVSGPAVRPLPRVRLEPRDNALYATGTEAA